MSANGATVPGESYVYGGVLFQRVAETDVKNRSDHTGIGTCLAQGLLTSAVVIFLVTVICGLLFSEEGFDFYSFIFFPIVLCFSMVLGSVQALVIGISIKLAGHDLRWFTRAPIGALVFALFFVALILAFGSIAEVRKDPAETLMVFGILGAYGAICGLVTGSRAPVARKLVRRPLAFIKEEIRYYLID